MRVTFLLLSLVGMARAADVQCPMCEDFAHMTWPETVLNDEGTTCAQMATRMGSMNSNSAMCRQHQSFWRLPCCGPNRMPDAPVMPTPAPIVPGQGSGPNRICHICRHGDFPGDPNHVINMLYIGTGTCQMYYDEGLRGYLPTHLCDALRFFAHGPCGCDDNPGNGNSPGNPGNPAPPADNPGPAPGLGPSDVQVRKNPSQTKQGVAKLSQNRGGAGARFQMRRRRDLKGSTTRGRFVTDNE